ncbi:MAG: DUF58 domain-containing protein [Opitutaceae bacterium]
MRPVPSQRSLYLAATLLPLGLFGAASPDWVWLVPLGILGLLILGVVDLYLSSQLLDGLRVELEPVTRLARDNEGKVIMHIRSDGEAPPVVTLGLPLPLEFVQALDMQQVSLVGDDVKHWAVNWAVTAKARGVYSCPNTYVEIPSVLNLFQVRRSYESNAEIRVYPNLRRERRQLANLFLNRGALGVHAQRMVGQGREFEQLREYCSGDSMLDVHWKASAKRGELVTKTYQVERTQEIYLVIDHSRLSGRRSTREDASVDDTYAETILERYVTAASVLGMVAEREGDLFGLVAFGQRVSRFVRASSGKQHGQVIQDALFDLKTENGPFDLDELFTFLRMRLRRRALVVFLTDLSDAAAAEEFRKHVGVLSAQHHVLVNSIRREGVQALYQEALDSSISEQIAGHMRWDGLRNLQLKLRATGVDFLVLDDEKLSVDLVNQYLSVKQRQLL